MDFSKCLEGLTCEFFKEVGTSERIKRNDNILFFRYHLKELRSFFQSFSLEAKIVKFAIKEVDVPLFFVCESAQSVVIVFLCHR